MSGETILIVDDSRDIARVLKDHMLLPRGYRVLYAPDGQQGLLTATSTDPDLILLDMNMPNMSGIEMLEALRETECKAPVIFMTLHGSESVAVEAFRLGVCNYLIKPFTPEEVHAAIDDALSMKRLALEKEELTRSVIATETVRQTTVTLAHYVNNYLMSLMGGLSLLEEQAEKEHVDIVEIIEVVKNSRLSATKIAAVLRVLQRVTNVNASTYHGAIKMIDVETALQEELERLAEDDMTAKSA